MSEFLRKIKYLFRRERFESDLEQELRIHLEMAAEERGERAARRDFGSLVKMREDTRSAWQVRWLVDLGTDLRYALRAFARNPGFAAAAIFSLALGIGANTAIFTLINALLLRTLPVQHPEQLVLLDRSNMQSKNMTSFPYPFYRVLRDNSDVFSGLLCFTGMSPSLRVSASPERVIGQLVSGNYFDVLGVQPYLGRLFTQDEDRVPGRDRVVVLSYGFWRRRFGGDPGIVGRVIHLNITPMTVIGVTPPGFDGTESGKPIDLRTPMMMQAEMFGGDLQLESRGSWWLEIAGRLKPGVSRVQAESAVLPVLIRYEKADPDAPSMTDYQKRVLASEHIVLDPLTRGTQRLATYYRQALYVLMAIVGTVLLIGCVNIANLLLARSVARQREIAVRLALGAGRWRIARQMLTESTFLAAVGGMLGIGIAYLGARVVVSFSSRQLSLDLAPDTAVLAFTLVLSIATGCLFGLAPAVQSARVPVIPELKGGHGSGGARWSTGKLLISLQVALSLVLLTGASLFARSLYNLRTMDTGFDRRNVVVIGLDPTPSGYGPERVQQFYRELRSRVEAMPGVRSASYAVMELIGQGNWGSGIRMEGYKRPEGDRGPFRNFIGPGYFHTTGIPIVLGREFTPEDTVGSPHVAIVNETFAKFYFGKENPIGKKIGAEGDKGPPDYAIVGVAKDGKYASLRETTPRFWYMPYYQYSIPLTHLHLYARTAGDPAKMIGTLRRAIQDLDRNVLISDAKTLEMQVNEDLDTDRLLATLSMLFSLLATVLAAIGLYGVMAYSVARRTRDMGIRIALGAERNQVLWLVLRDAMLLVAIGMAIGVPATLALGRLVSSLLFGLQANDPLSLALAGVALGMVAVVASYLPARRASKLDPMVALRYE